jgi:ABC-type transport system substrate-binding protein
MCAAQMRQRADKALTVVSAGVTAAPHWPTSGKTFYAYGASINRDGYCNPKVDKMIEIQSREGDPTRRKQILLKIEKQLASDDACPIIFFTKGGT